MSNMELAGVAYLVFMPFFLLVLVLKDPDAAKLWKRFVAWFKGGSNV